MWMQEEEQMWVVLVTYWAPSNHPWLGYQDSFDLLPDIRRFHGRCGRNLSNYLYGFWHSKTYFNWLPLTNRALILGQIFDSCFYICS